MAKILRNPVSAAKRKAETFVFGIMAKYGYSSFGRRSRGHDLEREPPYAHRVNPRWLRNVSNNQSVINNSIETKIHQTFRRGFTGIEKRYEAKCKTCNQHFDSLEPLKVDDETTDEELDLESPRICPECDEISDFETPEIELKKKAENFLDRANMRDADETLAPDRHASISQTYLELCREVARDIQIYDDGWMVFERSYTINSEGSVLDWDLQEVYRSPAQLMRYSVDPEEGKIGNEFWVCLECREKEPEDYEPEKTPGKCENCGNRTYEVFAYMLDDIRGNPQKYYIRGEFAHASEYYPSFLYGYSPVLSVWSEARTLEQMDKWYQEAYENRRAPRGALIVRSSNAESVRAWNTEQMEKLQGDNNHIGTFIDDTEGNGDPIKFEPLLEDPAEMQHMEMREWFLERVSAKFGVSQVFQSGGAEGSGMSQSLEILVTNRSSERLKKVFDDVFIPAFLGQLGAEGWTTEVAPPEPEDEQSKAQLQGRHLNNLQVAQQLGLDAEWTEEDASNIKPGPIEEPGEEMQGGLPGMMGGAMGGEPPQGEGSGETSPTGGRPDEPEEMGGRPDQPQNPSTEDPMNRQDASVTTGSSGYSNASYGSDEDPEIIDYLSHIQHVIEEDDYETSKAISEAKERYREESFGPPIENLSEVAHAPEKSFQDVRQSAIEDWPQKYDQNEAVRKMYNLIQFYE